jgi:hypothetical protein
MLPRMKVTDEDTVINFGKYNGKTFEFIIQENPSYIIWLSDEGIVEFEKDFLERAEIDDANSSPPEEYFWSGG